MTSQCHIDPVFDRQIQYLTGALPSSTSLQITGTRVLSLKLRAPKLKIERLSTLVLIFHAVCLAPSNLPHTVFTTLALLIYYISGIQITPEKNL